MNEWTMVRSMALRIGAVGEERLRRALDGWAGAQAEWLTLDGPHDWASALIALDLAQSDEPTPHVLAIADVLAQTLALDAFDTTLLRLLVAVDRLPRAAGLAEVWSEHGRNLPSLLGEAAGAATIDADRAVRHSAALRLGLAGFRANRQGVIEVHLRWSLEKLLDRATADSASVISTLIGPAQEARLTLPDFAHVPDCAFLVRLLMGASRDRASGVNILIHGPPGTGKTELARTLAQAAGLSLHGVGEADDDGDEPSRWERVCALQLAQRVMGPSGATALLFDEMEDLIGDAKPSDGDWMAGRQGSKVFINRLLETNDVPVIWTTNALGNVDAAILRRMSFVLELDLPTPSAARRMLKRISLEEGITPSRRLEALLDSAPETATVLRVAARAARLAGDAEGAFRPAVALVRALRGGDVPSADAEQVDLDLFESTVPLAPLLAQLAENAGKTGEDLDVSLLLMGPPDTGKTALAHHLARALDRPLVVKRASDLLSRWVGGTEAAIAKAFGDARERGHVLLFDEVDSLLFDRGSANNSWEAGQVNEMLTWLDRHPLPVIAATNHADRLDAAALRRFVFKIDLAPLGPSRAAMAFERFFGMPAPAGIANLSHLTPGDFAAVRRQLRHQPARDAGDLLTRLSSEGAWRPTRTKLGF
ncbi:AAA family ATPase [Nitrospirillum sp. BR 11164]|uniref:AAA family ATPase n=1 Tax=Nitrospirillum sp. BR 11164 TaxID=3104324 RepID=UPI002AFE51C2|nr:AAA family ATPase [Nitrospirillum sp. BR 11164]MEA1650662.1 AAA family ATPase [Nitrospirillum sp. BR 11164]